MYEDYLIHYGVKGMRWGVRRYQEKNGTYTPEGRARYISDKTRGGKRGSADRYGRRYDRAAKKANDAYDTDRRNKIAKGYFDLENSVSEKHQSALDKLNAEYERPGNKWTQRDYVKKYAESWNKVYVKELEAKFGKASDKSLGDFMPGYMSDMDVDDLIASMNDNNPDNRRKV